MNKADLVKELEKKLGSRKLANDALETVLDTIVREVVRGGKVAITGFGTFDRVDRAARTGRNPHTGTSVRIPKSRAPRFRPGTSFKSYVRRPSSLPKSAPATGRAAAGTASGTGPAKTSAAKKPTARKSPATAKKSPAKKSGGKKATAKKTTAKKSTAKKSAGS